MTALLDQKGNIWSSSLRITGEHIRLIREMGSGFHLAPVSSPTPAAGFHELPDPAKGPCPGFHGVPARTANCTGFWGFRWHKATGRSSHPPPLVSRRPYRMDLRRPPPHPPVQCPGPTRGEGGARSHRWRGWEPGRMAAGYGGVNPALRQTRDLPANGGASLPPWGAGALHRRMGRARAGPPHTPAYWNGTAGQFHDFPNHPANSRPDLISPGGRTWTVRPPRPPPAARRSAHRPPTPARHRPPPGCPHRPPAAHPG